MLYVTQAELDEHMAHLKENVPNGVCCTYEARPGNMVGLVAVRVGLCEFPDELLQLECPAPNVAINMCDQGCDAEVYLQGKFVGEACIEDIDALMCIALKVARYLGNGQIGPSDPLNPLAHCHGCQRSTHWDKTLMVPIPSHPYSSPVCRQEVVASASQLTIDAKSTTSAIVDLVLDSKSGLPGTAVGAGLGSTWLKRLEHVATSVACYCRSQTLNEE